MVGVPLNNAVDMALHNGKKCVVQHIVLNSAYNYSMCCYTSVYSIEHHIEQLVSVEQRIYWCESTLLKLPDVVFHHICCKNIKPSFLVFLL